MIEIKDLHVAVNGIEILKGINLSISPGEVHAIMGPNGSGKSTLSNVIAGRPEYEVLSGSISYQGKDLLALQAEERAVEGLFLAFQYPVEIPGVNNLYFLRTAYNSLRRHRNEPELDAVDFIDLVRSKLAIVNMDEKFLKRSLNEGFSGGEKKRNEILQMLVLQPRLAILDETDSGLDIDALQMIANGVNSLRDSSRSIMMITHYQRLLDYVSPDYVHVLVQGKIIKSGDKSLALELEAKGYGWLLDELMVTS